MRFKDRHDAGQRLAGALQPYVRRPAIVYALPRGGVPVGVEVALGLDLPIELAIVRKIGHPSQPEYAVCAVAETGDPVCNPREVSHFDPGWLADRIAAERAETHRRRAWYGTGCPRQRAKDRCAILVDDGLATGLSMEAAIREIRGDRPSRLIVAVPVAPRDAAEHFGSLCDDFVAVDLPEHFRGSVGAYYEDFRQLNDDDVKRELGRAHPVPQTPRSPAR